MRHIGPPASRLDAHDLRLVLALARAGSTASAASALNLTQPAVSRALLGLEGRLGIRLFERTPRGLQATSSGLALIDGAPGVLAELQALEARVTKPGPQRVQARMVCECYTAYHWMPMTLRKLRERRPELDIALAIEHTTDPVSALEDGNIDIALVTDAALPRRSHIMSAPLFGDEVVFVMSRSNALAAKKVLSREDLRSVTLLTSHLPTPGMTWFNAAVSTRGDGPLKIQLLPLTEALLDFARAGMGVAVLSEWLAEPHLRTGELVARRLGTGPLRRPWRMLWRAEHEATARELITILAGTAPRMRQLPAATSRMRPNGKDVVGRAQR